MARADDIIRAALDVGTSIVAGDPRWPEQLVGQFAESVGADTVGYADGLERHLLGYSTNVGGPPLSTDERALWAEHGSDYPFFGRLLGHHDGTAVRTSDLVTSMTAFRRTTVYAEHFGPRAARFQANLGLVVDGEISIVGLYRSCADFSTDEVAALEQCRVILVRALAYRRAADQAEAEIAGTGPSGEPDQLTVRQRAVLALVATGATNRVVARRLHISERTVRKHLDDVRHRLRLDNRVQATRWWLATQAGPGMLGR